MEKLNFGGKNVCRTSENAERMYEKDAMRFLNTVWHEDRNVRAHQLKEMQSSAEDPRVREHNESLGICAELKQYKREQFLDAKRRQRLLANNEELRILERQLGGAYVSSQVTAQKQARLREAEEQRQRQLKENAEVEAQLKELKQKIVDEEERDRRRKEDTRTVLHGQMAEMRDRRREELAGMMREGEEMKKMLQRFREEDEQDRRNFLRRRELETKSVEEFMQARELDRQRQREENEGETEKFRKIMEAREAEERRRKADKQRQLNEKLARSEHIGREVLQTENDKRKRQEVLLDLLVEERKALQDIKHRQYLERQLNQRLQAQSELAAAFDENSRNSKKRHEMSEDDKLFYEEQLRVLAERDKLEQLSNEKRRRRQMEHKRELIALIEERKLLRMTRMAETLAIDSELKKDDETRLLDIGEERKRLLLAQPPEVLRCVPSKILRPEEIHLVRQAGSAAGKEEIVRKKL